MQDIPVSIIVVSRNSATTIRRCLDSIINQTYPNLEIVVVDSSNDETKNILIEYKKRSPRRAFKLIFQEPRGVAVARNTGIKNASGEVLLFVDADCYIPRDYVAEGMKKFSSHNVLSIATNMRTNYGNSLFGKLLSYYDLVMYHSSPSLLATHFVRKKIYDLIGFYDEALESGEDKELLNRLQKNYQMLIQKGYKFDSNFNLIYYENKQEGTFAKYYKKCIWYAKPFKNKNYLKNNKLQFLGLVLSFLIIPILIWWVLFLRKSIRARMINKYILLIPFLMWYKSIFTIVGVILNVKN
jgi:glycosyltransferase involved in cell wall biosynthesis